MKNDLKFEAWYRYTEDLILKINAKAGTKDQKVALQLRKLIWNIFKNILQKSSDFNVADIVLYLTKHFHVPHKIPVFAACKEPQWWLLHLVMCCKQRIWTLQI